MITQTKKFYYVESKKDFIIVILEDFPDDLDSEQFNGYSDVQFYDYFINDLHEIKIQLIT
ncbi:hypothetical protein LCGC14_2629080, partial [marine sediment metagenome]